MQKVVKEKQGDAVADGTDSSFDFDDFSVYELYTFIRAFEQKKIVPAIDVLNKARSRLREAESGLEFVDAGDDDSSIHALRRKKRLVKQEESLYNKH